MHPSATRATARPTATPAPARSVFASTPMADDIRTRLSEALDEAEKLAVAAKGPWRLYRTSGQDLRLLDAETPDSDDEGAEVAQWTYAIRPWVPSDWDECDTTKQDHMVRWDPSTVLRLVERDRQLLA